MGVGARLRQRIQQLQRQQLRQQQQRIPKQWTDGGQTDDGSLPPSPLHCGHYGVGKGRAINLSRFKPNPPSGSKKNNYTTFSSSYSPHTTRFQETIIIKPSRNSEPITAFRLYVLTITLKKRKSFPCPFELELPELVSAKVCCRLRLPPLWFGWSLSLPHQGEMIDTTCMNKKDRYRSIIRPTLPGITRLAKKGSMFAYNIFWKLPHSLKINSASSKISKQCRCLFRKAFEMRK